MMNLQNPKGKNWPDFFAEQSTTRKQIENAFSVTSLRDTKLLLSKDLNKLITQILIKSSENTTLLDKKTPIPTLASDQIGTTAKEKALKILKETKKGNASDKDIEIIINKAIKETIDEFATEKKKERKQKILDNSYALEDLLNEFNQANAVKLAIFDRIGLYYCRNCSGLLCMNSFESKTCDCEVKVMKVSQTETYSIVTLNPALETFWKQNMWLEYGVETLFRQAGFETACGVYVLGASGIQHEIDLLAEKKKNHRRIIGECKNRQINLDDVFKLSGQMSDLGCHTGYIFSTGKAVNPDVHKLAVAKNIQIKEEILEQDTSALVKKLSKT